MGYFCVLILKTRFLPHQRCKQLTASFTSHGCSKHVIQYKNWRPMGNNQFISPPPPPPPPVKRFRS